MGWNYRVMEHIQPSGWECLAIHEVYYDPGDKLSWTKEPIKVCGDTIEELRETLNLMLAALDKEILPYE